MDRCWTICLTVSRWGRPIELVRVASNLETGGSDPHGVNRVQIPKATGLHGLHKLFAYVDSKASAYTIRRIYSPGTHGPIAMDHALYTGPGFTSW